MSKIAYVVSSRTPRGTMKREGVVMLEPRAGRVAVERALSSIGVYAPRGADELKWTGRGSEAKAVIKGLYGLVGFPGGGWETIARLHPLKGAVKI